MPDAPNTRIRLLAVDVDGTLVCNRQTHPQDVAALREAARQGIMVCLCTGRTWLEVKAIWQSLLLPQPYAPVVCAGGAIVVDPVTERTLYSRPFDRPTAAELARAMHARGLPVMALVDAWREQFDYYMIGHYAALPTYQRYFNTRPLRLRHVDELDGQRGPRAMRISVFAETQEEAQRLAELFGTQFGARIEIQAIHLPAANVHIVESFAGGTNKMSALVYVGQGSRIGPGAMAAIGDDMNDLAMLRGVALAAAPSDAPAALHEVAAATAAPRGQGAVAEFVRTILA